MNKAYNVLATLNNNLEKVHSYKNDKEVQAKRKTIFDIIKTHDATTKDKRLYRGYLPSSHYNYEGRKGNYTQAQALEKINQLEEVVKDGWVYSWDTETFGQPISFNSANINEADKLNNSIFSVTELAMSKQQYKNGVPVGDSIPVINFTSSPDRKKLQKYTAQAMNRETVANKTTMSTMTRIAGYSNPNNFDKDPLTGAKIVTGWDSNAKINDSVVTGKAITVLTGDASTGVERSVQFITGTDEYNEEVRRIFNVINEEILNSKNTILNSMNGLVFDNPVLHEFFKNAGINLDESFLDKLDNKTFDTQQILRGTSKPTVVRLQGMANASTDMTVENLIHAANKLGAGIENNDAHVAWNDTENSAKILNAFMPEIFKSRENILKDVNSKVPISTQAVYHANSAVFADENDLFFIDSGYDSPNVYNGMLMEPGHSYSIESYKINKDNIPEELKDRAKEFYNKKIIKMEDLYDGYNRSSYLVVDKQADIQEKILDKGNVITTKMNKDTVGLIKTSTEASFIDKARQTRDNFYRVNSDKGIKDFETYLESFSNYVTDVENPSKDNLMESLKNGYINGYNGTEIATKDALNRLFSYGDDGTLIHERAFNLANLYSDLENNYDLYSSMVESVNKSVGSYNDFLYRNNINDSSYSRTLYNKTRTSALASVKEDLNNNILNTLGDEEILDYVMSKNEQFSNLVTSRIDKRAGENKIGLNNETKSTIKKEAFFDFFGENFSKDSKHAQAYIFDKKELKGTLKEFEGIDIKNPNGDYSRIQINDRNNFKSSLEAMLYGKVKADNNLQQANNNVRRTYLKSVADDLYSRGLISSSTREQFDVATTPQAMTEIITNGVYETKGRFDKLVTPGKNINYDKLDSDDFNFVRNYMNNSKKNIIYSESNGFSVMGKSANDFVKSRLSNIKDIFADSGKRSVPRFSSYSINATDTAFGIEQLNTMLETEFGWTTRNVKNFMDKVINNKDLATFEYATSGKKVKGLSHFFTTTDDGFSYLVSTPFDKQAMVADKIARGANIDEINNLAVMWKIPKVEELGGVKVIKQGASSYKAVTKDLVFRYGRLSENNGVGSILDVEDTVDQVINNIGGKYGFQKSKKLMEQGSYKLAQKNLKSSWNKINSNKTLSSLSTRFKKGINGLADSIFKETTLNRADYALSGMVDISDMVYALDGIKDENLLKSFHADVNDSEKVLSKIIAGKNDLYKKKSFDEWDTTFKLWFSSNISEIAKEVIANPSFSEVNSEAEDIIRSMISVGSDGFFGKESGDANRGFFFLNSPREFVAGSSFSATSRPLLNQVMSALSVFGDDMVSLAQRKSPKLMRESIKSINDLERSVGFKMGHGYMTEKAISYSDVIKNLNGGEIGFTTKVKFMNSSEFLDKVNGLANIDEESFSKLIGKGTQFSKALEETGLNVDQVKSEYIRKIARNISTSTNLYEDSSLFTPLLGQILAPKTVTSVEFDGDTSRFKVGDKLETGAILFKDTGKRNDKNTGTIVDIKGNKMSIQLHEDYINAKIGIGFEKSEAVSPVINSIGDLKNGEEALMAHALVREISGGANIIMNPNAVKHETLTTLLSGYFNSIGYGLNDNNIDEINELLNNHLSNANMKYVKGKNGRYILSEGEKIGKIKSDDFVNFIKDVKAKNYDVIGSNIKDLEEKAIFDGDILTMQDNTIETSQGVDNIGKGSSISYRSQSVMGAFIGGDDVDELSKYRKVKDGKIQNLWQSLIDSEVEELASDPKFIRAQEQVQNIRVALAASSGEIIDGTNISKFSLEQGAVGSTLMTAEELPDIFKFTRNGDRVHAYEIDISDLNVNIDNFVYTDLIAKNRKDLIKKNKVERYVNKIIIPALDPNYLNDEYILTEAQKKASDLINEINLFRNGEFNGRNINQAADILSNKYKSLMEAYRFELDSKEGLYKRSMKIKSHFSSRMKVSKVAAPISDDGFTYKDLDFSNTSTVKIGGVEKYYASQFVNPKEFTDKGLSFETVGKQLVFENIDNSSESLNILKRNIIDNIELQSATDMEQARKILSGSNLQTNTYEKIGSEFLNDVGIPGRLMRDPAALSTSYQATRIRTRNITPGTFATDAVSAKKVNADVDGDEGNLYFDGLTTRVNKNGKVETVIRSSDDVKVKTIKEIMEVTSDHNLSTFKNEMAKYTEYDNSRNNIESYMEAIKTFGRDLDDLDYFEGNQKLTALLTRFSKESMGQISNPNYYLKSTSNSYFANNPYDVNSYTGLASINSFTDITEQKLLDFKGIKTKEEAIGMANLASSYKSTMDKIASKDPSVNKNALTKMYTDLLTVTSLDNDGPLILGYDKELLNDTTGKAIDEAIERILKGNPNTTNKGNSFTLEETLFNINKVLKDDKSNDLFFSQYLRQSDVSYKDGEYLTEFERNERALNQIFDYDNKLAGLVNGYNYLDSTVNIQEKSVNVGESLYSLDDANGIGEGIFKVTSIKRDGTNNFINLKNVDTDEITTINGSSFRSLSEKISHMQRLNDEVNFESLLSNKYSDELTSGLNGYFKIDSIINSASTETVKYRSAMDAVNGVNLDNLNDVLNTSAVLRDKGFINDSDATKFIKSMNDSVKNSGTKGYHDAKMKNLLGLDSLRKSSKISSATSLTSLLNNEVTGESIDKVRGAARISLLNDKVSSLSRFNVDRISELSKERLEKNIENTSSFSTINANKLNNFRRDTMNDVVSSIREKDKEVIRELKEIFSNNSDDLDFITDVLGLKLEEIKTLIDKNKGTEAIDIINKSKIGYGDYIGFNIGDLEDNMLNKIISSEYDTSGISSEVVNRTNKVIRYSQDLKNKGVVRKIRPTVLNGNIDESITNAIKSMNEEITNGASNSGNTMGKSIVDKISDLSSGAKNNKKLLLGSLAVVGTAIAASYLYGNSKMKEKDNQYVSKNSNKTYDENIIKQNDDGTDTNSKYYKVPDSNKKFYGNGNKGVTVNVNGKAKSGSDISKLNMLASRIFGGATTTVKTSISDSRKAIEDRDVDELMSQAVRF